MNTIQILLSGAFALATAVLTGWLTYRQAIKIAQSTAENNLEIERVKQDGATSELFHDDAKELRQENAKLHGELRTLIETHAKELRHCEREMNKAQSRIEQLEFEMAQLRGALAGDSTAFIRLPRPTPEPNDDANESDESESEADESAAPQSD